MSPPGTRKTYEMFPMPHVLGEAAVVSADFGLRQAVARVVEREDLSADEMALVVGQIMDGQGTPALIGGLLVGLRMKGETVG